MMMAAISADQRFQKATISLPHGFPPSKITGRATFMQRTLTLPLPNRRRFLALTAGSCGALLLGRKGGAGTGLVRFSRTSMALGSKVVMTALHAERSVAGAAVEAAFAEIERIEQVMSLYRSESELCRLNREGVLHRPDRRLVEVLRHAAQVSARSEGAFDVTVQPLWNLHAASKKNHRAPDTLALQAARSTVDWRRVKVDDARIVLEGKGTAVTLNGIAQGFAADAAMRVIRAHGVRDALIDTGEMGAVGHNEAGSAWRIGIQHPREKEAFAAVARLEDRCLATSGDYETKFSEDFRRHHIFDPRTGDSPRELASVSVLATTAMEADVLSTALLVMGAERGMKLLETGAETDALLIFKNGCRLATPGFPFATDNGA
jgi:thiamine biosynthesis lipoprotein